MGRAQLGTSLGFAPLYDQYLVNVPITIELDVEGDVQRPDCGSELVLEPTPDVGYRARAIVGTTATAG